MSEFYTTRGISFVIDEIVRKSGDFVILLTPYLKFSETLYERIKVAVEKNIELSIVYGKKDLTKDQEKLIDQLDCNIYFKENLHAKCYINEKEALVCSMNLHSYSEANNIEMGIKLTQSEDSEAYDNCLSEIYEVIHNSKIIKQNAPTKAVGKKYSHEDFIDEWFITLKRHFKQIQFTLNQRKIYTTNFHPNKLVVSNSYGFLTIEFKEGKNAFESFKRSHSKEIQRAIKGYRCFWSSPRICLYHAKNAEFNTIEDDIKYCLRGVTILLSNIDNFMKE